MSAKSNHKEFQMITTVTPFNTRGTYIGVFNFLEIETGHGKQNNTQIIIRNYDWLTWGN